MDLDIVRAPQNVAQYDQRHERVATYKPQITHIEKGDPGKYRVAGLGGSPPSIETLKKAESFKQGLGAYIDLIKDSTDCPIWNMPVIEQVRWALLGPQTDASVGLNFGASIDLFGAGKSPTGIDSVETTLAIPGQTQTYMIVCAVGFHLEPEPMHLTIDGNAWTHPTGPTAKPPSPDVFTQNDRANGALNAAIAAGTQIFLPAQLQWGWWMAYAFWHMARAYNLRWKIGQHTNIMDEMLRHTAYTPPNAQEGSSGASEVDVAVLVNRVNTRYDSLASALDFLKVDRLRIGSVGVNGVGAGNLGIFMPSRDHERVGVTYGGMDLRSMLKGNSEFRKLAIPYVIKAGVPIGLVAQDADAVQANLMRQYLSITQGAGGAIPPQFVDDSNITSAVDGTGAGNVALERTLDGSNVPQQVDSVRAIFKGGEGKITLSVKGFEVTEDWYMFMATHPDVRDVIMHECGVRFASQAA